MFKFVWLYPLSHFTGLVATFPRLAYNDIYAEAYLYAFRTFTPLPPRYSNRHGHVYADRYVFGDVACYAVLFCRSLANAEAPSEAH
ncbi:MAG: hypothetical protein ACJ8KC_06285 [Candidatus Udaeobacter sp.]